MSTDDRRRRRQRTFATRERRPGPAPKRPRRTPARRSPPFVDPRLLRPADPGRPLAPEVRRRLEEALDRPLGHVRVHTEPADRARAKEMGARAFAYRHHIWLGPHESASDVGLLAHEVAHVAQQGYAPPRPAVAASGHGPPRIAAEGFRAGRAHSVEGAGAAAFAGRAGVGRAAAPARPAVPAVQRFDVWGAARRAAGSVASGIRSTGRAVASGARAVGGAIAETGEALLAKGRDAVLAVVRRVAPDFLPLFEGDGIGSFIRRLVERGLRSMFDGLLGPLRGILDFGAIGNRVSRAVSWITGLAGQLSRRGCSAILAAARRVGQFFSSALGPVFDRIRGIADRVSGFFRSIWEAIGAPIMDMLKRIGGRIWESLRGFVRDVGAVIRRVRDALGSAWTRVKEWFGIEAEEGTEEGGGLWEWIKEKASSIGRTISNVVRPVIGPLRTVGGVLLLIIPGGQILAVMALWPRLREAWSRLTRWWSDLNLIPRARHVLANTVLPALMNAAVAVGQALVGAADWLLGLVERVGGALATALRFATGILSPLGRLIAFAHRQFQRIIRWVRSGLRWASRNMRMLVQRLVEFLGLLLDIMRRLIAIAVNPFGIVGFLAGTLWRLVPNCLKGPLINFILDIIIRVLRALPPLPQLGLLWPVIKAAALGFLERVRSFSIERKVNVSNRMAKIVSGMSPSFAFGYLKGLALGVWQGIIAPFQAIATIFELPDLVQRFLSQLGVRLCDLVDSIRCFAANLAGRVIGGLDDILSALGELLQDPGRVIELIRCAIEGVLSTAASLGRGLADRMMEVFEGPEDAMGEMLGRITGTAVVQLVIGYFTAGVGTAVGVIGQISRALSMVGRALGQVVRLLTRLMGRLVRFLRGLASKFAGAARGVAGGVLGRLKAFFRRVAAWFGKLLRRLRGRRGRGRMTARHWRRFKRGVRSYLRSRRRSGVQRGRLSGEVRRLRARYPRGVALASVRRQRRTGYLRVRAIRRGLPRYFSERILMDRSTRWRLGRSEIQRRLRRLWRRGTPRLSRVQRTIRPVRRRFGYRTLTVRFDPGDNEFDVTGAMSPGSKVTKKPAPRPSANKFTPKGPGATEVDPLIEESGYASPQTWSGLLGDVRPIRTRSGLTTLYIRGHLVSGWLSGTGGAENLTPLTRSANAIMDHRMERYVRGRMARNERLKPAGKVPDRRTVYAYSAETVGTAGGTPPRRYVGRPDDPVPVSAEQRLARGITIVLKRKRYNPTTGNWVKDRRVRAMTVLNVPSPRYPPSGFPRGHRE